MPIDWEAVREEFPALSRWTFLNTATFGQIPTRATEAVARHFARRDEFACDDFLGWFDDADAIRAQAARLIHAEPADIAFVTNASTALSLLLGGIPWSPGDRVVTLENEFPNQFYYPAMLGRRGVEFVETSWDGFYDSITPRTRLVAMSTVSYMTGFRAPLEEIGAFLRERGVMLFLDGTQSLGAVGFDVRAVRPDMFAVHAYKWLLSPNGAGFMYVSPELRERLDPNVVGWRSHRGWRNHDRLHHGIPEFKTEAEKYEGGMLNFAGLYAMGASLGLFLELGPEEVESRVAKRASQVREVLRQAGARLLYDELPHHDSPIIAASFERDTEELTRRLKAARVLVASRHGRLRVSPHFYNNQADIERFASALKQA
jgi:selenocysteine lyase/cysteine desulfurase